MADADYLSTMKAKKETKPRIRKTWRLQEITLKKVAKLAKKKNIAESEVIEILVFDYND